MTNEVSVQNDLPAPVAHHATQPMALIAKLVENPDFNPDKLEKLMDLQERWERNEAEKAFNVAMTEFQADVPNIVKTKKGAHDVYYAPLDEIMKQIQPVLTHHGFAVRFTTKFIDRETLEAICTVSHKEGHSVQSSIVVPIDSKQVANSAQKMGGANSYAKRYALSNALNLAYAEQDDDAVGLYETINDDQQIVINDLLEETKSDVSAFLRYAGAKRVQDISTAKYERLVAMLERKR